MPLKKYWGSGKRMEGIISASYWERQRETVKKNSHYVRFVFTLAKIDAVGKSDPAVEESSPAVDTFFHGICFLRLATLPKIDAT